ncbi:PREDICTED: beta-glucosidase 12-like [Nelumbo nucifera]|nr:PREDICTED: beta-glucosidase 12-like [Nelumbo nucifera]
MASGDYPDNMRSLVGNRLPKFSQDQSIAVKGSFDFLGLNYYSAAYAANASTSNSVPTSYLTDSRVTLTSQRNGVPIGPKSGSDWLYVYPRGIQDMLLYVKARYNDQTIYIIENGVSEIDNGTLTLEEALRDDLRIDYHCRHFYFFQRAIQ